MVTVSLLYLSILLLCLTIICLHFICQCDCNSSILSSVVVLGSFQTSKVPIFAAYISMYMNVSSMNFYFLPQISFIQHHHAFFVFSVILPKSNLLIISPSKSLASAIQLIAQSMANFDEQV